MSQQRKTRLCWEGWCYLVVLAFVLGGAILREVNLLFVLAGMLAGPMVLSLRTVMKMLRGLKIERTMPQGVCAGDPLVINLELVNTRHRVGSFAVVVEERIEQKTRSNEKNRKLVDTHEVYFPYVPAGKSRQQVYRGRLARRGRYSVGPVRISTRFPFGLVRRTVTVGEADSLLIYPKLGRLTRRWAARQYESFEGPQQQRQRYHRAEGEYYGVREWRGGDSLRSIHWRSSARRGHIVVRQFEQPHTRDLMLLVDLWRPDVATAADLENVEKVVSFAATVVVETCRQGGSNFLLGTTAERPLCVCGPATMTLAQEAMEQLAVAQADSKDLLARLFEEVADRIDLSAEVVLVSTRSIDLMGDERLAGLWNTAARRALLRRIQVVSTSNGGDMEDDRPMLQKNLAEYFETL